MDGNEARPAREPGSAETGRGGRPEGPALTSAPPLTYWIGVAAVFFGIGALFLIAYVGRQMLIGIVVALVFALGLEPVLTGMMRRFRLQRGAAVGIVLGSLIVVVVAVVVAGARAIGEQVSALVANLPAIIDKAVAQGGPLGQLVQQLGSAQGTQEAVSSVPSKLAPALTGILGAAQGVFGAIVGLIMVVTLWVYLLFVIPQIRAAAQRFFPPDWRPQVGEALDHAGGYLAGMVAVAVSAGIFSLIAMLLLGVPFAVPLAMLVAALNPIPFVGFFIAVSACVLVAFGTKGTTTALLLLGYFLVYDMVQNYILAPRLYGKHTGLSAVAAVVALMAGFSLLGAAGPILTLPIAAGMKVVYLEWSRRRGEAEATAGIEQPVSE